MKLLLIVCALTTVAAAAPGGLLKVPKIYNAVITSNQNLSPSRAFPVIQPVIHRTAVGYVPPFYYTQIAPQLTGPEVVHYPLRAADGKIAGNDQASSSTSRLAESTSFGVAKERESAAADRAKMDDTANNDDDDDDDGNLKGTPKKNQQVPLSFYPNYHSLYYEPYVYTYNSFNPHLVPGTYYVDYQPYGSVAPISATVPRNADPGHLLPMSFRDEKRAESPKNNDKEMIPNVPPPPLPTSAPKSS